MANDFLITIEDFTTPAATDPNKCRVFGFLTDLTGTPLRNFQIHITNKFVPQIVTYAQADVAVLGGKMIFTTNDAGYVEFDLFRNSNIDVMIPTQSPNPFTSNEDMPLFSVTIPDAASVPFQDLMYPVPDILEFLEPSPLVLAVDDSEDIKVKLTLSNKIDAIDLSGITFLSSDDTKVTVTAGSIDVDGDLNMTLTRLAAGAVFITAEINLANTPIRHQPPRTIRFFVNSLEDLSGYQVT